VWGIVILPVAVKVPVAGLYSSALARSEVLVPPATRTIPFCNSVAVWYTRAVVMLPVAVNVPVDGSYSSAVDWLPPDAVPPVIKTMPFCSRVAV
jgi:hypothetical protein